MDDHIKVTIDLLYKEFQRIQAKSLATDDWFFRFLSIAVVPFFAFVAYGLANAEYQIFLAALPLLSVIGATVVLMLSTHYFYIAAYGSYLQSRINALLGSAELRDNSFSAVAYRGWSPVAVSHTVGFLALIGLNLAALPIISVAIQRFTNTHPRLPRASRYMLANYWPMVITFLVVFLGVTGLSLFRMRKKQRQLIATLGEQQEVL